jgi:hypothetical protein
MKRLLSALVILSSPFALANVAGASTPAYGAFANARFGDCAFAAIANLTMHEYPAATISTANVLDAWGFKGGQPFLVSLDFVEDTGFDGHTATFEQVTTLPQIINAANHGGVWATWWNGTHAVAIIAATPTTVTFVNSNAIQFGEIVQTIPWSLWWGDTGKDWHDYGITWMS